MDTGNFNDIQVLYLDAVQIYFIVTGLMPEFRIEPGEYASRGEVYLAQIVPEDRKMERKIKARYDQFASVEGADMPPFEDLMEYNGLIAVKAKYHVGAGRHSPTAILFDDIIPLDPADQLTWDDDGNIVKA